MDYASSSANGQQQEQEQARRESTFRILWEKQTYVNLLYLLVAFPLGIFYIVVLLLGLVSILSNVVTVIPGIFILLLAIFVWWRLAKFERNLAMRWLHVEISPMAPPRKEDLKRLERFSVHLTNVVTWKSLAYLFVKFPLGTFSFVAILNLFVLTLGLTVFSLIIGLLVLPFLYLFRALPRGCGEWREARTSREGMAVDRVRLFLLLSLTGFGFALIAFHVLNILASVSGQFARVMLGLSDTRTRLAQAEAFAEEERAKAERADQSRRELIVNVSHELRTPIASIHGHIESLVMEMEEGGNAPDGAELRDYLNVVHREAERLSALVEDLLSLARMDADELHLDVVPISAGEVVEEVYVTMAPLARRERHVTFIREVAPMLPLVLADRQRLVQILLNLIRNAITYTPQGGIVSITVERADDDYLALVVADTGIGIPNDDLERVFERFYRTDASRARTSGGFGLGLAIVRDLVKAMGGSITVESKVGEGSCFRVLLRIAAPGCDASVKGVPFG
ncbi:MAG: sensor domain-containing protein [Ktedonobacteraceae bacterium]|nr:sensor domain-containing protein [Ktedonobacteraceae bacterium]